METNNDARGRRPGGRNADTGRRIFDATTALLIEGGMPAATFQAIAERAGVARATLYRRWPAPAVLVAEAVRAAAADHVRIPDTGTLRDDLHAILNDVAAFIESPLGRAALVAGLAAAQYQAPGPQSWSVRWGTVRQVFDRAVQRGELSPDADAAAIFAGLSGALYFRAIVMDEPVDAAWVERVIATL